MRLGHRELHTRFVVGAPVVLIATGWLALWLLWPSAPDGPARRQTGCRVRFVGEIPLRSQSYFEREGFGRPSRVGFGVIGQPSAGESVGLPETRTGGPRFLDREPAPAVAGSGAGQGGKPDVPDRQALFYLPGWSEKPVFKTTSGNLPAIMVRLSPSLQECGFCPPALSTNQFSAARGAWQVVLVVEVGTGGHPEHVFVESGCESPEINATIARLMYGGTAPDGRSCSGRVWVGMGLP